MLLEGTVFRVNSGNYHVETGQEGVVIAKLRGNLKKELIYSTSSSRPQRVESTRKRRDTDPIAVGDRVRVDTDLAVIEDILPRRSEFSRDAPSQRGQHTLVANLDHLFVVFAAREPNPDLWLLDRFLVAAEAADIPASIIINKIDLIEGAEIPEAEREPMRRVLDDTLMAYERIGYKILKVSARENLGLEAVRDALRSRISAFAGPSGVGKSRLLNALCPGLNLRVGDIGYVTYKGRHTTTTAELIPLKFAADGQEAEPLSELARISGSPSPDTGSWVADTPGLRQLQFWQVPKEEIQYCFREFTPYFGSCRFADCRHRDELGCAIRVAVEAGEIDPRRYQSFKELSA